jgi:hypothetical protein
MATTSVESDLLFFFLLKRCVLQGKKMIRGVKWFRKSNKKAYSRSEIVIF